jgi:hypothetical protein
MFASGPIAAIVLIGVAASLLAVLLATLRYRSTSQTATKLVDLALTGRADEARIQARNATRDIAPLLDALGGELAPPKVRLPVREMFFAGVVLLVPIALCVYAITALDGDDANRAQLASAFLIGLAVLAPLSIAAAFAVIGLARQTTRAIRGSSVTLLARQVKSTVDAENAEALRRGNPARDPRGE